MYTNFILNQIKQIGGRVLRLFIVSIALWICAYALPDFIESPYISDKLIQSVYYGGRKVNKVSYEDLRKRTNESEDLSEISGLNNENDISILENYYSDYINKIAENNPNKEELNSNPDANLFINPKPQRNEMDERKYFSNNLYSLYGNRTIFNVDLNDLEKMVRSSILTDSQAVIFWESLLQMKTDRAKIIYGKAQNELDTEYYLFNFIAMKTTGLVIITIAIFLITHKIQVYAIRNYFIYNLICSALTYYIMESLYTWKYYIASSIMFIQLGFCIKYKFDSLLSAFGLNKEDYDIFSNIAKTKTPSQFIIKLMVSSITTLIIGYFALCKFKYFFNYILFYVCLIQMMYLISFYLQYEAALLFQPFKHFILILLGLLNFLFTNFHKKISRFNYNSLLKDQNDSFYIVSETFSFICISYLYEYLLSQATHIAHLFTEKVETDEMNKKTPTATIQKEHQKSLSFDDCLWIVIFTFGVFTSLVGVARARYLTFIFSLQYFKIILKVFGSMFKVKILRCVLGLLIFFLVITNHILSNKNDLALFDACNITNSTTIGFIKFVVRMAGLVFIILTIIANFEFIVIMNEKKNEYDENGEEVNEHIIRKVEVSATYEKKKKRRVKTIEIQIVKEDTTPFSFMNMIYIHLDLYTNYFSICLIFYIIKDIEKNYLINLFYAILVGILVIRMFFIINEFKNHKEFLYSFMICFMIGIRLLTITRAYNSLYFVSAVYLFILVIFYSLVDRRNILLTFLIFIHLYSACIYLHSNFLLILMILMICLPISIMIDDNKYPCSVLRFFLPGIFVMFFQLYGFKNIFANMISLNIHLQNVFKFDIVAFNQKIVHGSYINEFEVIESVFSYICSVFQTKNSFHIV